LASLPLYAYTDALLKKKQGGGAHPQTRGGSLARQGAVRRAAFWTAPSCTFAGESYRKPVGIMLFKLPPIQSSWILGFELRKNRYKVTRHPNRQQPTETWVSCNPSRTNVFFRHTKQYKMIKILHPIMSWSKLPKMNPIVGPDTCFIHSRTAFLSDGECTESVNAMDVTRGSTSSSAPINTRVSANKTNRNSAHARFFRKRWFSNEIKALIGSFTRLWVLGSSIPCSTKRPKKIGYTTQTEFTSVQG
jgi:hypothetical protein